MPLPVLKEIPYGALLIPALFLGLAPFVPEPHLEEKLRMLSHGALKRPLDIFDLFFHLLPLQLLPLKFASERVGSP